MHCTALHKLYKINLHFADYTSNVMNTKYKIVKMSVDLLNNAQEDLQTYNHWVLFLTEAM